MKSTKKIHKHKSTLTHSLTHILNHSLFLSLYLSLTLFFTISTSVCLSRALSRSLASLHAQFNVTFAHVYRDTQRKNIPPSTVPLNLFRLSVQISLPFWFICRSTNNKPRHSLSKVKHQKHRLAYRPGSTPWKLKCKSRRSLNWADGLCDRSAIIRWSSVRMQIKIYMC